MCAEEKGNDRRGVFGWAFLLISLIFYYYLQVYLPLQGLHSNDFKHLYLGAKLLREGHNPYDAERVLYEAGRLGFPSVLPYVYPPFTGLVLEPLTFLSFRVAVHTWFWFNQAFFLGALLLTLRSIYGKLSPRDVTLWIFYSAIFFPLTRNFTAGQLNVVLLFCFALVWHFHEEGRAWAVGVVSAFAALFKLSPIILLLYFFWKRQWRNGLWSVIFYLLFLMIAVLFTGWDVHKAFLPIVGQMSYGHSTWEELGHDFYRDPFNQSFNSFFHHVMTDNPYTKPWVRATPATANVITMFVSLILVAVVMFATYPREGRRRGPLMEKRDYALFIMLSLFLPSLCWDHYLVQALWAIILLSYITWRTGAFRCSVFALVAAILLAIRFNFAGDALSHGVGILFMSLKLWGALTIFLLLIFSGRIKPEKERHV